MIDTPTGTRIISTYPSSYLIWVISFLRNVYLYDVSSLFSCVRISSTRSNNFVSLIGLNVDLRKSLHTRYIIMLYLYTYRRRLYELRVCIAVCIYKQNTAIAMVHINKKNSHICELLISFG